MHRRLGRLKAANSASLQLIAAVCAIIGSIAGTAIGGANWLNGKFSAQDARIGEMAKEHGQRTAEMQHQIDSLRAVIEVLSAAQPRQTRELTHELLVTKSARVPAAAGMRK